MMKLVKINKSFGDKKVLSDINFEIENNGVIGLLGPNGAGKTTLMRIIVGYFEASEGKILWDKKKVNTQSKKHKKRIGYLAENNPLYGYMTVNEYFNFIKEIKNSTESLDKIVKSCGLREVIFQKIETLSKGFKQRVGLAAALIGNPKLLILDEPTSGLDPNQIIEIRQLIKNLARNRIVILSTHILPEARTICERLLIISNGKIVLNEKTDGVKNLEKKFVELTS